MNKPEIVRRGLLALVGVVAGLGLMTSVPSEESGRTVIATAKADGGITLEHKRGREYLTAYADIVGVWTICDGLTGGVKRGQVETREGCTRRLEAELVKTAERSIACVPTLGEPGRDYQRWAFISLAYNVGTGAACGSTAAKRLRARDWAGGCQALLPWNKAGRPLRVVRGLALRRERERQICLTGLPGYPPATLEARVGAVR